MNQADDNSESCTAEYEVGSNWSYPFFEVIHALPSEFRDDILSVDGMVNIDAELVVHEDVSVLAGSILEATH